MTEETLEPGFILYQQNESEESEEDEEDETSPQRNSGTNQSTAGAFDYAKFRNYVYCQVFKNRKSVDINHLRFPNNEETLKIRNLIFTKHSNQRKVERFQSIDNAHLQELQRSLTSSHRDCLLWSESRRLVIINGNSHTYYLTMKDDYSSILHASLETPISMKNWKIEDIFDRNERTDVGNNDKTIIKQKIHETVERWLQNLENNDQQKSKAKEEQEEEEEDTVKVRAGLEVNEMSSSKQAEIEMTLHTIDLMQRELIGGDLSVQIHAVYSQSTIKMMTCTCTLVLNQDLTNIITLYPNQQKFKDWLKLSKRKQHAKLAKGQRKKKDNEKWRKREKGKK